MDETTQALQMLLTHLRSGQAKGLDVLFEMLGQSGPYRLARQRYPLREVAPLRPSFPGEAGSAGALADALNGLLPQATTSQARLNLLERFGGFVAAVDAHGREVGGVSWFDQARLRLALDACGDRVLVVRTDLSGIQPFIYTESEKALKSLRARSFYLELLAVHLLRRLLDIGGVTRANVAYAGGGGFGLYLPATREAEVLAYARDFDTWLWQEHQGTLGLSLACVTITPQAAQEGQAFQAELSAELSRQKSRRRHGRLAQVFAEASEPYERQAQEEALAERLVSFGTRLPRATHLEVREVGPDTGGEHWITVHDHAYRPFRLGPATPRPASRIALNSLNDLDAFPMLTGNYVTRVQDIPASLRIDDSIQTGGQDSVATHEQLAELALGQPRLALYRCDADNMGTFFAGGIPGHDAARHATLSRLMSLFFQGYVNAICAGRSPLLPAVPQATRSPQEGHGRYLNVIYSGGDDAVVVGAWNEVLTFAVDLRRAYRQFTGGNPLLGLSGGAFIAKAKYPLRRMAERAHDAEQLAKQATEGREKLVRKDGFVPFLTADAPGDDPRAAVRWNTFTALESNDGLQRTLDILDGFLRLKTEDSDETGLSLTVKRAFLWNLQAFAERENDAWRVPLLHYALTRATPPVQQQGEWQALQALLLKPSTWPHLGHVLGFLHLARPNAEARQDLERSRE